MGMSFKPGRHKMARALVGIYETKQIIREDQELFQKTLSDLKREADSALKNHEFRKHNAKRNLF